MSGHVVNGVWKDRIMRRFWVSSAPNAPLWKCFPSLSSSSAMVVTCRYCRTVLSFSRSRVVRSLDRSNDMMCQLLIQRGGWCHLVESLMVDCVFCRKD